MDLVFEHEASIIPSDSSNYDNFRSLEFYKQKKNRKLYEYFKIRNHYNQEGLLCELDNNKIELLKNILQKKYPLSYKCLENTDKFFYSKE
jgi:hypothetical protein